MSPNSGSDPGFTVSMSTATPDRLVQLHDQARTDGRLVEFVAALEQISNRLRSSPADFGEELFDLRTMNLTVKLAVILPVVVEFGVYADRHIVFVRSFRYVSRS